MSRLDFDDLARMCGPLTTRRAALGLASGLLAVLGLALGDRDALAKEIHCQDEDGNRLRKTARCPRGKDICCKKGNCCNSAVARCCDNSPVCRANAAPGCPG